MNTNKDPAAKSLHRLFQYGATKGVNSPPPSPYSSGRFSASGSSSTGCKTVKAVRQEETPKTPPPARKRPQLAAATEQTCLSSPPASSCSSSSSLVSYASSAAVASPTTTWEVRQQTDSLQPRQEERAPQPVEENEKEVEVRNTLLHDKATPGVDGNVERREEKALRQDKKQAEAIDKDKDNKEGNDEQRLQTVKTVKKSNAQMHKKEVKKQKREKKEEKQPIQRHKDPIGTLSSSSSFDSFDISLEDILEEALQELDKEKEEKQQRKQHGSGRRHVRSSSQKKATSKLRPSSNDTESLETGEETPPSSPLSRKEKDEREESDRRERERIEREEEEKREKELLAQRQSQPVSPVVRAHTEIDQLKVSGDLSIGEESKNLAFRKLFGAVAAAPSPSSGEPSSSTLPKIQEKERQSAAIASTASQEATFACAKQDGRDKGRNGSVLQHSEALSTVKQLEEPSLQHLQVKVEGFNDAVNEGEAKDLAAALDAELSRLIEEEEEEEEEETIDLNAALDAELSQLTEEQWKKREQALDDKEQQLREWEERLKGAEEERESMRGERKRWEETERKKELEVQQLKLRLEALQSDNDLLRAQLAEFEAKLSQKEQRRAIMAKLGSPMTSASGLMHGPARSFDVLPSSSSTYGTNDKEATIGERATASQPSMALHRRPHSRIDAPPENTDAVVSRQQPVKAASHTSSEAEPFAKFAYFKKLKQKQKEDDVTSSCKKSTDSMTVKTVLPTTTTNIASKLKRNKHKAATSTPPKYQDYDLNAVIRCQRIIRAVLTRRRFHNLATVYKDEQSVRALKRRKALIEICTTERSYVRDLSIAVEVYLKGIKAELLREDYDGPLTQRHVETLFGNMELLLSLNKKFLSQLEDRLECSFTMTCTDIKIGDIFIKMVPLFQLYSRYYRNHSSASQLLIDIQKDKSVVALLNSLSRGTGSQLSLEDYLIFPIQRIPRYSLLLRELLNYTPDEHMDYDDLTEAHLKLNQLLSLINTRQSIEDCKLHVNQIQMQLIGFNDLVTLDRHVVADKDGYFWAFVVGGGEALAKARQKRKKSLVRTEQMHAFLFNDCILLARPSKKRTFRFHCLIYWRDVVVMELPSDSFISNMICLENSSNNSRLVIKCKTEEDKDKALDILLKVQQDANKGTTSHALNLTKLGMQQLIKDGLRSNAQAQPSLSRFPLNKGTSSTFTSSPRKGTKASTLTTARIKKGKERVLPELTEAEKHEITQWYSRKENVQRLVCCQEIVRHRGMRQRFSEMVSDLKETESGQRILKRWAILRQALTLEHKYCAKLQRCVKVYEEPLLVSNLGGIQQPDIEVLFGNIATLATLSAEFRDALDERLNATVSGLVGDLFLNMIPMLRLYLDYHSKHEDRKAVLAQYIMGNELFAAKVKDLQAKNHAKALEKYLELPIEHISFYSNTLKKLLKYTAEEHQDYDNIAAAYDKVRRTERQIEQTLQEGEAFTQVKRILRRIIGFDEAVVPSTRRFIMETDWMQLPNVTALGGAGRKQTGSLVHVFIFNDCLITTERLRPTIPSQKEKKKEKSGPRRQPKGDKKEPEPIFRFTDILTFDKSRFLEFDNHGENGLYIVTDHLEVQQTSTLRKKDPRKKQTGSSNYRSSSIYQKEQRVSAFAFLSKVEQDKWVTVLRDLQSKAP